MNNGERLETLKSAYPGLALGKESGTEFILIPELILPEGCQPGKLAALLCPTERDSYPSRLFLSEKITHSGPGINWTVNGVQILGRSWWAVSWRIAESEFPHEILLNHLKAFKK